MGALLETHWVPQEKYFFHYTQGREKDRLKVHPGVFVLMTGGPRFARAEEASFLLRYLTQP